MVYKTKNKQTKELLTTNSPINLRDIFLTPTPIIPLPHRSIIIRGPYLLHVKLPIKLSKKKNKGSPNTSTTIPKDSSRDVGREMFRLLD
jgi:hypothetical protein